jgi:hypothetical protein
MTEEEFYTRVAAKEEEIMRSECAICCIPLKDHQDGVP